MDYESLINEVIRAVESAGQLLIAEWERPGGPRGSDDKADVDVEIESLLRQSLLAALSCDFCGEETGYTLTGTKHCWVVDPNDGTESFLSGLKGSAISVGLLANRDPVLGVVYAPVLDGRPPDCLVWARGMSCVWRNGMPVASKLSGQALTSRGNVMVSAAARSKPGINAELCAPAKFIAMPSIAYRLARVAAGDGSAAVSLVPLSAHDLVAGHALLIGAGGVLLDQDGMAVSYTEANMMAASISTRCFGGAPAACETLQIRDWDKVFGHEAI